MKDLPSHPKHKPIIGVEYEQIDEKAGAGDAKFLSIGRATWDNDCVGIKVWRKTDRGRWSRQSEDLPSWRVLDMAILLIATMTNQEEKIDGHVVVAKEKDFLLQSLSEYNQILQSRINLLKDLLNM